MLPFMAKKPLLEERIPVPANRLRVIASLSKTLHHGLPVTHVDEVDCTLLNEVREKMNSTSPKDVHLTFLPFVIKAVSIALRKHPLLNSCFEEKKKCVIVKKFFNIGVAVDTPVGLVVPVVPSADTKSVVQIASLLHELIEFAREGCISPEKCSGSTFTVTNIGAFGGLMATPLMNYPESGILGMYRVREKPVVREGKVFVRKVMLISLTSDHRVCDGAEAARFVSDVVKLLEEPGVLLDGV